MAEEVKEKSTEKKSKKRPSKFLAIGKYFLILLILGGQGFLAYAVVHKYYPNIYEKIHSNQPAESVIYDMEELVVNPSGTNGKRYLLVEISLEIAGEDNVPEIDKHLLELKELMGETLAARTVNQLVEVEGRENIRRELIWLINSKIGNRSVRNLYFTKYIMQ
ncbi:flagellar basal body-associated FliL family protein [Gracilimonas mengyeensis]|uniref:Flagellar protein FliL n=1 Tax=Gracilimonas mengyeensis TaxID=1302730 RepID=A0A521ECB2_9BACT|nr:flagellar basal body-associated FliL family protein [Gracilimonas mengyeensis]SMO81529.1 Flagellar basal body-associated protein FliL [Gracilimonas mengyeensis]